MGRGGDDEMTARRFFTDKIENVTVLTGEEFRHAANVLRVKKGDEVILCDNTAYEYPGRVLSVEKNSLSVEVEGRRKSDREPQAEVTLLCGYLKGDKTEVSVQKAVELGAKKIAVFRSEHCAAYMNENKLARLNKVSAEAAKQCGRSVAPEVVYFDDFAAALASVTAENKFFACEFAEKDEAELSALSSSAAVVVGPEGGFTAAEAEIAKAAGFSFLSLGRRILRADTAAVAALALVMRALGELG